MSAEMGQMAGKVVLVTGASRGIGAAIAERFVDEEAYVIGTATTSGGAAQITKNLEKRLTTLGGHGAVLDFLKDNDYDAFLEAQLERAAKRLEHLIHMSGKLPLDALVNNAGLTRDGLFARMPDKDIKDVIQADLVGPMLLSRAAVARLRKAKHGASITTVSSVVGIEGNPGQANYAAAKGGLIPWSRSLAKELGSWNIRSNIVAPGYVLTGMTAVLPTSVRETFVEHSPLKRAVQASEIAEAVLYLASDRAASITGAVHVIDAGLTA